MIETLSFLVPCNDAPGGILPFPPGAFAFPDRDRGIGGHGATSRV